MQTLKADDFLSMSASDAFPLAIAANASGNVFVGGAGGSSSVHWIVRKR